MDTSTFFARFLQPAKDKTNTVLPDDIDLFDANWISIRDTLAQPDERQLSRGIQSTDVPVKLNALVDALVHESNRNDEDITGACLEYFLKNNVLEQLGRLCENDRPRGIKTEVVKAIHNMVVLMSEHFLVHNAIHRPLRRLLRSCIGDEPEERLDGAPRVMGAAALNDDKAGNAELELELVDLMCILCSRMRSFPPLLLIFFHDCSWTAPSATDRPSSPSASTSASGSTSRRPHRFEFLLFSYLLRFVHREGRIGDFARAGLLFLFDIAFLPDSDAALQDAKGSLAEFVLDGDTCDVIAAGLGAVYSVLPSKLRVPSLSSMAPPVDEGAEVAGGGMHLGVSSTLAGDEDEYPLPLSTDEAVRTQLDLMLKLLGFVHDMLSRASTASTSETITPATLVGAAIIDSTLASIESSFLSGILYPSILESSPNDGSAVAVISYLHVLLVELNDGVLLESILRYLLGLDSDGRVVGTARHKKSSAMILLEREQRAPRSHPDYFTAEGRFTLKDLVLDNLRSGVPEATAAALGLVQGLLGAHCGLSVEGMLLPVRVDVATAFARLQPFTDRLLALDDEALDSPESKDHFVYPADRDLDSAQNQLADSQPLPTSAWQTPSKLDDLHQQETDLYLSLLLTLDPSTDAQAAPQAYMNDILRVLRDDPCYLHAGSAQADLEHTDHPAQHPSSQHRLSPSDPILRTVLRLFGDFFAHEPDENLAMTGVMSTLAMCPNRSLAGWMVCEDEVAEVDWDAHSVSELDDDESLDGKVLQTSRRQARPIKPADLPALYQVLRDLTRQIDSFRNKVEDFDRYLGERRRGLLFADHLNDAMNVMLDIDATTFPETPKRPTLPKARSSMASSLRSFLTPKKKSDLPPETPPTSTSTPFATPGQSNETGSPFQQHYSHTKSVNIHHRSSAGVEHGPWSPARRKVPDDPFLVHSDDEDESEELVPRPKTSTVSLSAVLDHCVVLEEFIKELTSIIVARRACGIDQIAYI